MNHPTPQRGFSLIEVLVSLIILAVGILGLAALQFTSLKYNRDSSERVQAIALSAALADKMRANRLQAQAGAYNTYCGNAPATTVVTATTAPARDCAATTCTAAEYTAYDLNNWCVNLVRALPGGIGRATCADATCAALSQHRVTVAWPQLALNGVANPFTDCADNTVPANYSCITVAVQP